MNNYVDHFTGAARATETAVSEAASRPRRRNTNLSKNELRKRGHGRLATRPVSPAATHPAAHTDGKLAAIRGRNARRKPPAPVAAALTAPAASLRSASPVRTGMNNSRGRKGGQRRESSEQSTDPGPENSGQITCKPGRTALTFHCSRYKASGPSWRRTPRNKTWARMFSAVIASQRKSGTRPSLITVLPSSTWPGFTDSPSPTQRSGTTRCRRDGRKSSGISLKTTTAYKAKCRPLPSGSSTTGPFSRLLRLSGRRQQSQGKPANSRTSNSWKKRCLTTVR
jgi:hypothetical protein